MKQGERLRLAIKGTGKTVEEAAKTLGIGRTSLYSLFALDELPDDFVQNVQTMFGFTLDNALESDDNGDKASKPRRAFFSFNYDVQAELLEAYKEVAGAYREKSAALQQAADAEREAKEAYKKIVEFNSSVRRDLEQDQILIQGLQRLVVVQIAALSEKPEKEINDLLSNAVEEVAEEKRKRSVAHEDN
jgi:hypothetical protein